MNYDLYSIHGMNVMISSSPNSIHEIDSIHGMNELDMKKWGLRPIDYGFVAGVPWSR